MALQSGTRLGPYEVLAPIGAGGMGEVYRARDARLGRDVAVKVLPPAFASDTERLDRFEQEARAAAALNHPNLLAVYDLGRHDGAPFIVSELLEGETVRERLQGGPLPVRRAVEYAVQMAHGLAAAHEKGIVHRDLKPENLFVTSDGRLKILDFGLAKLTQAEPALGGLSAMPTTPPNTLPGVVLGTIGYMAPEQVRGVAADHRADIFAFGTILYEMLSGQRAFRGETTMDAMTAILKDDPPDLPAAERHIPPALERIVDRCLEKSPAARFQSTRDLAFALEGLSSHSESGAMPAVGVSTRRTLLGNARLAWAVAAVFALAALALGAVWAANRPVSSAPERLSIVVPTNLPVAFGWTSGSSLNISPDGSQVVYVGRNLDGGPDPLQNQVLLLRSVGSLEVRALEGTGRAVQPFFSPDGQWVAFFTGTGELKKVALSGGAPLTLVEKINGGLWAFGTWTDDGSIVFGGSGTGGLQRVSADGGSSQTLTALDSAQGELTHVFPEHVTGTNMVLFGVTLDKLRDPRIEAVNLGTGARQVVLENAGWPHYLASGHLLFRRDGVVMVAPFDVARLALVGSAVPVIDEVRRDGGNSDGQTPQLVVSPSGTAAYVPGVEGATVLGSVTRDEAFAPLGPPPGQFDLPRVSSDGRYVAYQILGFQQQEVHVHDVARGSSAKLTQEGRDGGFAWHPNSQQLAVSSTREGARGIFLKDLSGAERLLLPIEGAVLVRNMSWTPDGTQLAYTVQTGSLHDIWVLTMGEKPAAAPLLNSPASEHSPRFSPDGRWLAYVSDESGRAEVYVRGYPQGERFAVSAEGGTGPVWSAAGRELFFDGRSQDTPSLMVTSVDTTRDRLQLGKPVPLLNMRVPGPTGAIEQYAFSSNFGPRFDVFPDGKRFVMIRGADMRGTREIVLVKNFFEEVRRLTGTQ